MTTNAQGMFPVLRMKKPPTQYSHTPDKRYLIIDGVLWRASNPDLNPVIRQQLVDQLMSARRAIAAAQKRTDREALRLARSKVNQVKTDLGERGPVWWTDGAPDFNRHLLSNTPYKTSHRDQ